MTKHFSTATKLNLLFALLMVILLIPITKPAYAVMPRDHQWSYSDDGNKINATCINPSCSSSDVCKGTFTARLTVAYPGEYQYTGIPVTVDLSVDRNFPTILTNEDVVYYLSDGNTLTDALVGAAGSGKAPVNVGTYIAKITAGGKTAEQRFSIVKGTPTVSPEPQAATGLVYDGTQKALITNAATASGGTLYYALVSGNTEPTDSDYTITSEASPKAINAGTYKVYYKVIGDEQHNNKTFTPISVTIAKQAQEIEPPTEDEAARTKTKVALNPVSADSLEGQITYAKSTTSTAPTESSAWQTGTEFSGLTSGMTYYFFAKCAGDENHAEAVSTGLPVTLEPEMFTISSASSFTVETTKYWDGTVEYRTGDNEWTVWDGSQITAQNKTGETDYVIMFRGTGNTRISYKTVSTIDGVPWGITGTQVRLSGNMMTLLDYEHCSTANLSDGSFWSMFEGNTCITDINDLLLPAAVMKSYCYAEMFSGCTGLRDISGFALPAETLGSQCYQEMFKGCTNLVRAMNSLPATVLKGQCYHFMFAGCSSLLRAPDFPENMTSVENNSCSFMFTGCSSLITAPVLSATTLNTRCYASMFEGCTSLTNLPELPAAILKDYCYSKMFSGCKSIEKPVDLRHVTSVGQKSTYRMYDNAGNICLYTQGSGDTWALPASVTGEDAASMFGDVYIDGVETPAGPVAGETYYLTYSINITAGEHGSVSPSEITGLSGIVNLNTNDNILTINGTTVTATPAYGYEFDRWDGTPSTTSGLRYIDSEIRALFKRAYIPPYDPVDELPPANKNFTVPVKGNDTVQVVATINANSAVLRELTETNIAKMFEDTASNTAKAVTIDLSEAEEKVNKVTITKSSVQNIVKAAKDEETPVEGLEVKLSNASLKLDDKAVNAVNDQAEGNYVELIVEDSTEAKLNEAQQKALSGQETAGVINARIESNGVEIHEFNGGNVEVSIAFLCDDAKKKECYFVWYLAENGEIEKFATKYKDGKLSFVTGHLSDYVIVYDESAENDEDKAAEAQTAKTEKTPYFKMSKTIGLGNRFSFSVTNVADDATVKYTTSDAKIATVDKKGTVTAVGLGKCTVTGKITQNGVTYKFVLAVTVKDTGTGNRSIKESECVTPEGEQPLLNVYKLVYTDSPVKLSLKDVDKNTKVTYTSENEKIATISDKGVITGIKKGYTGINVTVEQSGQTYSYRVYVRVK